jgi:hypothetical protein
MARKTQQKPQEEAPKEEAAKPTKYSKAELLNAAYQHFGVTPEVMAGALYGKEEASKAEAEKLINAFLSRGVK